MERNARTEKDVLGQMSIDADDLRGIHTHRALHNFNISGRMVSLRLIHSYALVKKACAMTNREEGYLDPSVADAICGYRRDTERDTRFSFYPGRSPGRSGNLYQHGGK